MSYYDRGYPLLGYLTYYLEDTLDLLGIQCTCRFIKEYRIFIRLCVNFIYIKNLSNTSLITSTCRYTSLFCFHQLESDKFRKPAVLLYKFFIASFLRYLSLVQDHYPVTSFNG